MKKLLLLVVTVLVTLVCADNVSAQVNFGVIGGATFSTTNVKEFNEGTMTQYHAGLTLRVKLPAGFSIQPSLLYQVKGANVAVGGVSASTTVGYLELPVSFQWGPDLILFRPFLDVTPFAGYGLNNKSWSKAFEDIRDSWNDVNRWEYGVGTGLGFDIWKFQVIARYNWNLSSFSDEMTFSGATLSLAYLF
jgi:hypothetical protein